jgi:hypothetical protein
MVDSRPKNLGSKTVPRQEALQRLAGVIPKRYGLGDLDPLDLKRIWEPTP